MSEGGAIVVGDLGIRVSSVCSGVSIYELPSL